MVTCSNCQNIEVEGALFCSRCGAQIPYPVKADKKIATSQVFMKEDHALSYPMHDINGAKQESGLSLHILEAGKIISLANRTETTLGRSAEGQPLVPDVDLASYQGFEKGVSRIHLSIHLEERGYFVTDLGSVNGSQLNSQKMTARRAYPLHHGDILSLGRMNIQVLIRK